MVEFQATKIVKKTRKVHQCCICNRTIPKGFSCLHATGKSEGEFSASIFVTLAGNYRASSQTAYATGGRDIGATRLSMILAVNTRYRHRFNY